jgi:hypothetical protein
MRLLRHRVSSVPPDQTPIHSKCLLPTLKALLMYAFQRIDTLAVSEYMEVEWMYHGHPGKQKLGGCAALFLSRLLEPN